uniref:acyltransferase domain-containing protein n=1 Tax=Actinosynnema sp. TaxID=1872144 RepID=UPI003F84F1B9
GELAAAHVAGVFSLDDAARLVAARGRLMHQLPATGAMVAVEATEEEVRAKLAGQPGLVDIAAVNGPRAVVLAGEEQATLAAAEPWRALGRRTRRLNVSHAFHSPLVEPVLDAFAEVAATVTYHRPTTPIVSTLTGAADAPVDTPDHWVRHVRGAVRFAPATTALVALGATTFLEVGPDTVLATMAEQVLDALPERRDRAALASTRRDRPEVDTTAETLALLHTRGVAVDWAAFLDGSGARHVDLPTYGFQRDRYALVVAPGAGRTAAAPDWEEIHPTRPAEPRSLVVLDLDHGAADLPGLPVVTTAADVPADADAVLLPLAVHLAADPADTPEARYARTRGTLDLVQGWDGPRLVVTTTGIAPALGGDRAGEDARLAWTLLRAAAEHNGRVLLVDLDTDRPDPDVLAALLAAGVPLAAARGDRLLVPPREGAPTAEPVTSRLLADLAAAPAAKHRTILLAAVLAEVASVLHRDDADGIEEDRALQELGFDSLTSVDLRNRLNAATGAALPATAVFDHPTPAALADHLLGLLAPGGPEPAAPLHAELDRLESLLATAPRGGDGAESTAEVADRLRAILARLTEPTTAANTPGEDPVGQLAEATADDLFAFIDNELGRTAG